MKKSYFAFYAMALLPFFLWVGYLSPADGAKAVNQTALKNFPTVISNLPDEGGLVTEKSYPGIPELVSPRPEKPFNIKVTGPRDRAVLYEQLAQPSNEGGMASQQFPDFPAYSCQAADDFIVPDGETWLIEQIYIPGMYSAAGGPAQFANLMIYENDPLLDIPGSVLVEYPNYPVMADAAGNLDIDLSPAESGPISLDPGTYWISVQVVMEYGTSEQWYWVKQESPTIMSEYHWTNPGGGFEVPGSEGWVPGSQMSGEDYNLGFGLYGVSTAVETDFINGGFDHWTVPCGYLEFGENGDFPPIPADFFGPGSDPFDGIITLVGNNSNGSQSPQFDAMVNRLGPVYFSEPYPSTGTIDIQIELLNLKSDDPILINVGGVDSFFDVFMEIDFDSNRGGMDEITKVDIFGGTFLKDFYFWPIITFVEVGNPANVFVYKPNSMGLPPLAYASVDAYPWTHSPIEHEFDPMGEDLLVLQSTAGNNLYFMPFLVRYDNFFLAMNEEGFPEAWEGTGYNNGEWYYYPNFEWWNVWFYDHPVDNTRRKVIDGFMMIEPRMPDLPSYVEIVFNWSTPEWSGWPEMPRPPLPEDVIDPGIEEMMIQRSEPLIIHQGNIFEPIPVPVPYEILEYNPEWLSIDIRGYNFILNGEIQHVCFKEGECPTGEELEYGDAPEGALAYPASGVPGKFPTCMNVPVSGHISHGYVGSHFGPTVDFETEGNAGFCPAFNPNNYNMDECFADGDAGLIIPDGFTITGPAGSEVVSVCPGVNGIPLGKTCHTAMWGTDIDIEVHNNRSDGQQVYFNLLLDWDQDGYWSGSSTCYNPLPNDYVPEHSAVNVVVPAGFDGPISALIGGTGFQIGPNPGYVWARFSLTDVPVGDNWNGEGIYGDGETEDYLLRIEDFQGEEFDWGDAPDPMYPTLMANNGAHHSLDGYTYLGTLIDTEPNGQPNLHALGDDLNNLDDEDGVKLLSSLIVGAPATVRVKAANGGMLNAWFDFNSNGSWADAGEHVYNNVPLTAGDNDLVLNVPAGLPPGDVYARFRVNQNGFISYDGYGFEGEVEDYKFFINDTIPDTKTGNPQYPDPNGWDVNFTYPATLGDDWICSETGAVEDFHFWVSWLDDVVPDEFENAIEKFDVHIYSDIPAADSPTGYSMPGEILWLREFFPGQFTWEPVFDHLQGWYDPYTSNHDPQNHYGCYRIDIDNFDDPFIQQEGTVYWLVISAHLQGGGGGGTQDVIVTLDNLDPSIGPYTDFVEAGVVMQIQDLSGPAAYQIDPDGISMWPALLSCDLTGLPGTVMSVEVDVIPWCGPGCGADAKLYGGGMMIDQKTNSGSGVMETLVLTNPGGYVPDLLTIGCFEGKVLEIRFVIESGEGYHIGWKTSIDHWNDNAAYLDPDFTWDWIEMYDPTNQEVLDLAFVITGNPVEDNTDFGDAPDTPYPTLLASDGARHTIDGITYLGDLIDGEADGQPSGNADGDDLNNLNDEDGVSVEWPLIAGSPGKLKVKASVGNALFNAWFDFNRNGSWGDPGEHVFVDLNLIAGTNKLTFIVPAGAIPGGTYARFRFSHQPALDYKGAAFDGEVEDYFVEITEYGEIKWQQLPDPDLPGLHAHENILIADDWICAGGDVTDIHWWGNYELINGGINHFMIRIYTDNDCLPGNQILSFQVPFTVANETLWGFDNAGNPIYYYEYFLPQPFDQIEGNTYWVSIVAMPNNPDNPAIWRWNESSRWYWPINCGAAGFNYENNAWTTIFWQNPDPGMYSDMAFIITSTYDVDLDYGDAPDQSYQTLLANDGARHHNDGITFLGDRIDVEPDGQPTPGANGDDLNNLDDEDGVIFIEPFVVGKPAKFRVKASVDGYLNTWLDLNMDGDFADASEHIFVDQPLTAGLNTLTFNIPAAIDPGRTYIRFRFNTSGGLSWHGFAQNGEVEDYRLVIFPPDWGFHPTGSSHVISVPVNIALNCVNLAAGEFIGTFYTDDNGNPACGGAAYWDGVSNKVVVAYGDDQTLPAKTGFDENEDFAWKIYHTSTSTEEDIVVDYDPNLPDFDGKFHDNGLSALTEMTPQLYCVATADPDVICAGDVVDLDVIVYSACGTTSFAWTSDPPGFTSSLKNPTDTPDETTTYYVTVSNIFGASHTCSVTVDVNPLPVMTCPDDFTVCLNDDPITLAGGLPAGGSYSGPGVVAGIFYPSGAGVGTHSLTYTYTDPNTNCTGFCVFAATVNGLPQIDCPAFMEACESDLPVLLDTAYPDGGEYSGTGVTFDGTNYWFNPAGGVGTYLITFCYIDPVTLCSNCCEFNFTVYPTPDVECPNDFVVCIDQTPFALTGATPSGGTYSGSGVSGGIFDPDDAGAGDHTITYTYTSAEGCTGICEFIITVIEVIMVCPDDMTTCIDDMPFMLTGATPAGGTYSGPGVSGGQFNPAAAGAGVKVITYTYVYPGTNCSGSCQFTITVNALPNVDCPADFEVCLDSPKILLDVAYPLGGIYNGPGVIIDGTDYYFDPSTGLGSHVITYCYTDPATGCTNCCSFTITVVSDFTVELWDSWSGLSSYIVPDDPDIVNLMYPIMDELVLLMEYPGSFFYPMYGTNTIGNWNEYNGYVIRTDDDCSLPFCGDEVVNKTLTLSAGWQLIPVLSSSPADVATLFAGVNNLQIVKDVAGMGVYWPAYGLNTIGNLIPGEAYFVRMSGPGSITFPSQADQGLGGKPYVIAMPYSPWNEITFTPASHNIVFNLTASELRPGDVIGGFTADGLCSGIAEVTEVDEPFCLSLNADDVYSAAVDGFAEGEYIQLKVYRPDSGETFDLTATWNPEMNTGQFESHGMSEVISVKVSSLSAGVYDLENLRIYPNPSHGSFTIEGIDGQAEISVVNTYGEEIYRKVMLLPEHMHLEHVPNGVYLIRIKTESGVQIEKLIIN